MVVLSKSSSKGDLLHASDSHRSKHESTRYAPTPFLKTEPDAPTQDNSCILEECRKAIPKVRITAKPGLNCSTMPSVEHLPFQMQSDAHLSTASPGRNE